MQILLGIENSSSEEVIAEITLISIEEKKQIIKEIKNRGWLTIIIGLMLLAGMIYTSKVLADNNLFGSPQIFTVGMSGFIGIIIANGLVSIFKGQKLLK